MSGVEEVLRDLVDTVLAENLAGASGRARLQGERADLPLAPHERRLSIPLPQGGEIALRARPGHPRAAWRLSRPPVLRVSPGLPPRRLDPHQFLTALAELLADAGAWPSLPEVLADLAVAPGRADAAAGAAADCVAAVTTLPGSLLAWERVSALRDRPFHATARVRSGWTAAEHDRYGPDRAVPMPLDWVAVRRDALRGGSSGPVAADPADEAAGALSAGDAADVRRAMEAAGVGGGDHVALPVHPWQRHHVLPVRFATEMSTGVCTPLPVRVGAFVATASVRTVAPVAGGPVHVKLPLGVGSLGALRLLPGRYLRNGDEGQALLTALAARDPTLGAGLRWCDERSWWTFDGPGVPEEVGGHLGCLLRRYPSDLAGDPGCMLMPLAALGVTTPEGAAPALSHLGRALRCSPAGVLEAVAAALAGVALSCFAAGAMPELHGQNVVLAVRDGRLSGILLRDHDTVRIHPPWLRRHGVAQPDYLVAHGTPNTLVNDTPEALLSWFQTLGVNVALAAAVEAEAAVSGHDGSEGWDAVAAGVADALHRLELPEEARRVARRQLLDASTWPAKLVLTPLLERAGAGTGSMPSARGHSGNPLLRRGHRRLRHEAASL